MIGLRHLVPARFQPERARLLLQIGELTARHLVQVHFRSGSLQIALEGGVLVADGLPVEGDFPDPFGVETRIAVGAFQRLDDGAQAGLRGVARERIHRRVDGVGACLHRGEHRRRRQAGRVVRVEMDRQVGRLAQRLEQDARRAGLQEACHVLDGDDVGAGGFQFPGQPGIVVQVVFSPVGVEDVAGVAHRRLDQLAFGADRVHGDAYVLHPVQAIEDAEQVDAAGGRLPDEMLHDVVRVVGVADAVGAAQQHLQQDVGRLFADQRKPLPRVFGQEAHGDVEGRAAPAFERQQSRQRPRVGAGDRGDIVRAHARRQQRLMAVAHRRVGNQNLSLRAHPLAELFRPERVEPLACAVGDRAGEPGDNGCCGGRIRLRPAARLGMAVDGDVAQIVEELGGAVLTPDLAEQFRRRVDEPGRVGIVGESRVVDDRFQKGQVRGHAADAELAQGAGHARDCFLGRRRPGRHLLQQRIVVAGDDGARIGRAAVETDAEAGRPAIGGDAAVVGDEILFGVLRGDAALQGMAVETDAVLRRHTALRRADRGAVQDMDLRLDDVDAGHLLGHRMLDLDARIDLDEVEFSRVGIHEEFDGAGADIVRLAGDLQRVAAQFLALRVSEIRRRRALHDLLVAALDRAVALEQMHDVAVGVAQHLHLDMAGALDQFFEIDLVLAEGGLRLALALVDLTGEVGFGSDGAHATSAAAPRRLEHDGIADAGRKRLHRFHVVRQRIGGRHDRHADLYRQVASGDLVAQPAHRLGLRADEGDAVFGAGLGEFGAFREQPVAGMDGVGAGELRHPHDLVDRQVAFDRPHVLRQPWPAPDLVALVRLETVQRVFVFLGPDRHGLDAQFTRRAEDADGDFGPVGDKDLADGQERAPVA